MTTANLRHELRNLQNCLRACEFVAAPEVVLDGYRRDIARLAAKIEAAETDVATNDETTSDETTSDETTSDETTNDEYSQQMTERDAARRATEACFPHHNRTPQQKARDRARAAKKRGGMQYDTLLELNAKLALLRRCMLCDVDGLFNVTVGRGFQIIASDENGERMCAPDYWDRKMSTLRDFISTADEEGAAEVSICIGLDGAHSFLEHSDGYYEPEIATESLVVWKRY